MCKENLHFQSAQIGKDHLLFQRIPYFAVFPSKTHIPPSGAHLRIRSRTFKVGRASGISHVCKGGKGARPWDRCPQPHCSELWPADFPGTVGRVWDRADGLWVHLHTFLVRLLAFQPCFLNPDPRATWNHSIPSSVLSLLVLTPDR